MTIGATPWVSQTILPRALADFQRMRSGVRLDFSEAIGTSHAALALSAPQAAQNAPQESSKALDKLDALLAA